MNWTHRVKRFDPPAVDVLSVYDLEGYALGRTVYVLAPGSSFDRFPKDDLRDEITIGVNSIVEIFEPTFAFWQEGTLCKKYYPFYSSGHIDRLVTTWTRVQFLKKVIPPGRTVYGYQEKSRRVLSGAKEIRGSVGAGRPWWYDREFSFLPGRNSIAFNALSLAVLMQPLRIVLVGLDLHYEDKYYADGIRINRGPRNRRRALSASKAWGSKAAKRGVWSCTGIPIQTTSPWLRFRGIERI